MQPRVIDDPHELRSILRVGYQGRKVALVPTMGALHEGHLSLVAKAKELAEVVVVSVFVNPTQFAPGEDFESYPRDLEADLAALSKCGADLVFAPSVATMYPNYPGVDQVTINPGPTATILEGATRPTHFAGVAQVVAKLLHLVSPDLAVFGQKDAQQVSIVRQMVKDLAFPVDIVEAPIIRDADGLALSSRNMYLVGNERQDALALSRALQAGLGEMHSPLAMATAAFEILSVPGVQPDYAAVVTAASFDRLAVITKDSVEEFAVPDGPQDCYLLVAAKVGRARLIDNVKVVI